MSYDLWVWAGPAYSADAVLEAIALFDEAGEEHVLDPSPALPELHAFVLDRFPALESLDDDASENAAWSVTPMSSERAIGFSMPFSRVEEVATVVVKAAFERGLLTFDPQDMTIYPPAGLDPDRALTRVRRGI
jgi:hypothetical protein